MLCGLVRAIERQERCGSPFDLSQVSIAPGDRRQLLALNPFSLLGPQGSQIRVERFLVFVLLKTRQGRLMRRGPIAFDAHHAIRRNFLPAAAEVSQHQLDAREFFDLADDP